MVPVRNCKSYMEVDVRLKAFVTSTLDWDEWAALFSGKEPRYLLNKRPGGSYSWSWTFWKENKNVDPTGYRKIISLSSGLNLVMGD
jgi:hypothetical protein